ncbi:helix-turn-helix domain-containing protein [Deinococcus wulumuqiensis]|uniref:helix-turn-helix domain-containing protein n=1 Tax=Deinococcus wulumuqiensis TaxID=980427 RepID=UPI00034AF7E7|nr:helix-turn-helix domain-containing protein [Deinococcus wulumuqiensis]
MESFLAALGQRIRALRTEDFSQEDFAAEVDVFRSHMSLIEQGQVDLRLSTVYRIARGLDLSVSELLDLETQAGVSTETASETGQ